MNSQYCHLVHFLFAAIFHTNMELCEKLSVERCNYAFQVTVNQHGNKSVSWVRVRDGHILSVDRAVFIADQRFQALKLSDKFWTLQIKTVQARDTGAYECQVSTEPKISAKVHLWVIEPRTEMLGDPDRYGKAGSTLVLRCIVEEPLAATPFITWYHGSRQLTSESARHRMQMEKKTTPTPAERFLLRIPFEEFFKYFPKWGKKYQASRSGESVVV